MTTYGSVGEPEPSVGGACNYGSTKILRYAAIQVNVEPGDTMGAWKGGRACGRCARVRAQTTTGWKTTVVRITDKCPDVNCGIDLGGQPAHDLMGIFAGRYSGDWEWISCKGIDGVYDGEPSLVVKEGSNAWWSLVQVRNGLDGISQIRMRSAKESEWRVLEWAIEAENFMRVPTEALQDTSIWEVEVQWLLDGSWATLQVKGTDFSIEKASYPLTIPEDL